MAISIELYGPDGSVVPCGSSFEESSNINLVGSSDNGEVFVGWTFQDASGADPGFTDQSDPGFGILNAPEGVYTATVEFDEGGTRVFTSCTFTIVPPPAHDGCPTGDVTQETIGSTISLTAPTALSPPHQITHTINSVVAPETGLSVNAPIDQVGVWVVVTEVCTEAVSEDKRTNLLARADRQRGYGLNATGGTNYVFPKTPLEFLLAVQVPGNYVCLEGVSGDWMFSQNIFPASDVTIDGANAPNLSLCLDRNNPPQDNFPLVFISEKVSNIIVHSIKIDGKRTGTQDNRGGIFVRGVDVWIDHIEATGFWDDAILPSLREGDRVTVSNSKTYDTDKALSTFRDFNGDTHVTAFNNDLSSDSGLPPTKGQRAPNVGGTSHFDAYNNYIHGFKFGSMQAGVQAVGNVGVTRNEVSNILSLNNVFEESYNVNTLVAQNGLSVGNGAVGADGFIYEQGSILNGHQQIGNVQPLSAAPFTVPYTRDELPASEVKAFTLANAGLVEGSLPAERQCETFKCSYTVVEPFIDEKTGVIQFNEPRPWEDGQALTQTAGTDSGIDYVATGEDSAIPV